MDQSSIQRQATNLLTAGFVTSGSASSGGGLDSGVGLVVVSSVLGAFAGLLCGLIAVHLLRYISFLAGRSIGGYGWIFICTFLGAVIFACLAVTNNDE